MPRDLIAIHDLDDPFLNPIRTRVLKYNPTGTDVQPFATLSKLAELLMGYGDIGTLEVVAHGNAQGIADEPVQPKGGYRDLVDALAAMNPAPHRIFLTACHTGIGCSLDEQGFATPCIAQSMAEDIRRGVWGLRGFFMRSPLLEGDLICSRFDDAGQMPQHYQSCSVTADGISAFHQFSPTGRHIIGAELASPIIITDNKNDATSVTLRNALQKILGDNQETTDPAPGVSPDLTIINQNQPFRLYYNGRVMRASNVARPLLVDEQTQAILRPFWLLRWV